MHPNTMNDRLGAGETLLGLCNMYPAPGIIEGMGHGWDFIWVDGQHGQLDYAAAVASVRAAQAMGLSTLLRVPTHEHGLLGMFADADPEAIMVPMVNTADEARRIVNALRFPPEGMRSYGGRRVIDRNGREYYRQRKLLIVAQIETVEAVDNVEAIIETPGVDALFFGPDDMKAQMGLDISTSPTEHPKLLDAMRRTGAAATKAGKFCGGVAPAPAALSTMREMGFQFLVGGGDIAFLRVAAADKLKALRDTIQQPSAVPTGEKGSTVY